MPTLKNAVSFSFNEMIRQRKAPNDNSRGDGFPFRTTHRYRTIKHLTNKKAIVVIPDETRLLITDRNNLKTEDELPGWFPKIEVLGDEVVISEEQSTSIFARVKSFFGFGG